MPVKATMIPNWSNTMKQGMRAGLLELITDVQRRSAVLAPKDTRALVNSAKISMLGSLSFQMAYGNSKVPYARIHELGGKTGRRYKTTIKAKHYLKEAGENAIKGDFGKYFRGKV